jgi:hypothetical protein
MLLSQVYKPRLFATVKEQSTGAPVTSTISRKTVIPYQLNLARETPRMLPADTRPLAGQYSPLARPKSAAVRRQSCFGMAASLIHGGVFYINDLNMLALINSGPK